MRVIFTFLILSISTFIFSQTNCIPGVGGVLPGDNFPGCVLCVNVLVSSNEGFTPDATAHDACGSVENSIWFSFYADNSGSLGATFLTTNCLLNKGLELSLFDKDLNKIDCFTSALPGNITASNLRPSELHHVMVDGIDGDECGFTFIINNGADRQNPPGVPDPIVAVPDETLCIGDEACYSVNPTANVTQYVWEIPNFMTLVSGGGLTDTEVCVKVASNGGGLIKVTAHNDCFLGNTTVFKSTLSLPILDGPNITCANTSTGIDFAWDALSAASEYQVFVNGSLVATTTSNFYSLDNLSGGTNVNFRIQALGAGNCSFRSSQASCTYTVSGIDENKLISNQLIVVPNPTNGNVSIQSDLRIQEIDIYDATGRFIQKENSISFDLKKSGSGIYFLKVKTSEGVGVKRVLVQ